MYAQATGSATSSWPRHPLAGRAGCSSRDCPGFSDDAAYRAKDFPPDGLDDIAAEVLSSVTQPLNLDGARRA
jgi:hypothetical protein